MSAEAGNLDSNKIAAMQACIDHARALLQSAKAVQVAGHPNIAYHLAVLTLEEIGRRALMKVQSIAERRPVSPAWIQRTTQSHIKKLFWCFFSGPFFGEPINKERFESLENIAHRLHAKRIAGLYVDSDGDNLSVPADNVDADESASVIALADAHLNLAASEIVREDISSEEAELQAWFLSAVEDPEKQRAIMSKGSLDKLVDLEDARPWALWLKDQFDRADAESRAALEAELQRSRALPSQSTKDKWKIRIRLYTQSHSIRPGVLTTWNRKMDWIKLIAVPEKKDQLIVEFILGDNIPVESLWLFGWGLARHFTIALNIGTMGFWWWRMPQHISRYYETLEDFESKRQIAVERVPSLKVDWGSNRVLSDEDLGRVSSCFVTLPRPEETEQYVPYNFYIDGITFLSLNDVHWQCETQSFGNFFHSVRSMMGAAGDWESGSAFTPALMRYLNAAFPDMDEKDHFARIFEAFENNDMESIAITLREASFMKLFCDSYYLHKIMPVKFKARMERAKDQ
jgi:AbiV family abortive infection protein